jgi:tetratricopeptide (TPR) repeat protein
MSLQTAGDVGEERLQRAIALKVEGRYAEALEELRGLLDSEPGNARAHRELGLVLNFTGEFDESINELRRAVSLDSHFLEARCDLALAHMMLGQNEEALAELEAVLAIEPDHPVAMRHIVYLR